MKTEVNYNEGTASMVRPLQKVSSKEKNKEDWKKGNINYWAARCNIYPISNNDAIRLYKAAGGKIEEEDYTYVTNPLNTDRPELKGYPSKMRNIDIISTNILTLLGELSERYFNPMVSALNSNFKTLQEQEEFDLRFKAMKQLFVNALIEEGVSEEELQSIPDNPEVIKKKVSSMKDELSKMGQDAIDYIMQFNEVQRVRRKTFYDFCVLGKMFTYRDIRLNDTEYEWISPLELSYLSTPNKDFIEDADAVKRTVRMSMSQVIDRFQDVEDFTPDIISTLEQRMANMGAGNYYNNYSNPYPQLFDNYNANYADGVIIEHVQWTSMTKMYKVEGIDAFGNAYILHMDEDYIPEEGEEIEEYWVNQKWEGYRIDNTWIVGVEALPYQKGNYYNPSKCKNSYNGRVYNSNYITPQSLVEKGMVYQIKYNIVHYYLEMVIAKNMDKITLMPLGLIPNKEGWDEFTVMYYAKATGFLFIDETNPNAIAAMQHVRSIDLSLSNYIKEVYGILRQIKEDWDEAVGISRQRKGQTLASDGKGVNEEAIFRSSVISEELFQQHEETILKDLQCLMDLSKVAWREGKKANFLNSEFRQVDFEIDPTVYQNADFAVFVRNSGQEKKALESNKAQLQAFAQNSENLSMIPKISTINNMAYLQQYMDELEEKILNQKQATTQAEQQHEKEILAIEQEDKQKDRDLKKYEIDENNDRAKDIALLNAESNALSFQEGTEGTQDAIKLQELFHKRTEASEKFAIEREKINEQRNERLNKNKIEKDKIQVERENMKNDKEIALINARNRKQQKSSKKK